MTSCGGRWSERYRMRELEERFNDNHCFRLLKLDRRQQGAAAGELACSTSEGHENLRWDTQNLFEDHYKATASTERYCVRRIIPACGHFGGVVTVWHRGPQGLAFHIRQVKLSPQLSLAGSTFIPELFSSYMAFSVSSL